MHSLSRKSVTAVDHILHSAVLSIGDSYFNAMAIQ